MICEFCSAEQNGTLTYGCTECNNSFPVCALHGRTNMGELHVIHKQMGRCKKLEDENTGRRQLACRGDFAVDMQIVGEQGERRYFLCGPDEAMDSGVTLANLEAVWHLIGKVIVSEKK